MRQFKILDLLGITALVALHLAAFRIEATFGSSDWTDLVSVTPTAITCLLHLRLRLRIRMAMVVHYISTLAWTFMHSLGYYAALNAYERAHPPLPEILLHYAPVDNAWDDTLDMAFWGIALSATYGMVAYAAVQASLASSPRHPPGQPTGKNECDNCQLVGSDSPYDADAAED
ncbi:hypothetical protein [Novipirellula artificiosorum]|uniref:Uncharacterized protein n=1 Tax=Novipirellula artificiosorum TaxID=2528016 RepID=A0A5C6E446_9BACT|nr:hypothetical protein [Novipirellula artificiosorum]TWU42361.1 hypothetical protein Poly41_06580 [Novipirellula artificiosorum]